ncbi:MAG: polysaccharide deacetylase family protein [Dehalococcoidia bacterium]|nr:polysaccharide deacetylase family protein [Dehalococcoidia bacterium]
MLFALFASTARSDDAAPAAPVACEPSECTTPLVTPILEIPGDSADPADRDWTPPVGGETPGADVPKFAPSPSPGADAEPSTTPAPPGDFDIYIPEIASDKPVPTPTPTPTPRPGPVIYLTFDDGPHPTWTPRVLEVLERYAAYATFFTLGTNVDAYPWIAADIVAAGHAVANHSYTHANLALLGRAGVESELVRTQSAIASATERSATCLRPPFGSVSGTVTSVADSLGLDTWLWDVDPQDWARPGAWTIANRIISVARPTAVVLLHDGGGNRSQTVEALEIVLAELSARGYRFETLPC